MKRAGAAEHSRLSDKMTLSFSRSFLGKILVGCSQNRFHGENEINLIYYYVGFQEPPGEIFIRVIIE